jgi:organic hydroperoxide reductase OsmC/OhrA
MNFPHHYRVAASCTVDGPVRLLAEGLPELASMPPVAFGGPGDKWSPEDLIVAAVADCFVLSFRAIAQASKFGFINLTCKVTGTLDKVEKLMAFTEFKIDALLSVGDGVDHERAKRLLEKAEQMCLITNSLTAQVHLETSVKSE